jgi:GT2 family glycosyltransferase
MKIDLVLIASGDQLAPLWRKGRIYRTAGDPRSLAAAASAAVGAAIRADFVLFWDTALGAPDEATISTIARTPGDVWHGGLCLGLGGLPRAIDYVDPVWRFNRDPDPDRVATSWRMSLRVCLARLAVLERLGGPDPHFATLEGASLELGHRWIRHGAMMRHVARLLPRAIEPPNAPTLPLDDEIRFLRLRYGRLWTAWACARLWRHGAGLRRTLRAFRRSQSPAVTTTERFLHEIDEAGFEALSLPAAAPTVSVLIPTLERYPYLFNLLECLRLQTVPPLEIIVVDQTSGEDRDVAWPERFADLPLRVIWRDQAGQCTSRNAGLQCARGDTVLFLDDDDEAPPDLIARHLAFLHRFEVDASCGVAEETGGALPVDFTLIRDSDVFPTNNSLLRTAALERSGLFDLAFERGERADHDLGTRLYLSGARLGLNPTAAVVHRHAPRGGLRAHRARVVTRSASRASLWARHLLTPTEAYLWLRYYTAVQAEEAALIRTVGALRGDHTGIRRWLRAAAMLVLLPDTWRRNRARLAQGRAMLRDFPIIPAFAPASAEETTTL